MTEYIMQEEKDMDGVDCYIRKGELIHCRDCRNLLIVAWIGDEAEPYAWMCDHWHMSTEPEGFCHKAREKRKKG